jgi:AbiU2
MGPRSPEDKKRPTDWVNMKSSHQIIQELRQKIRAAQEEFDLAVTFHEVWKPGAYDTNLHGRMGTSYATQAFNVVLMALRREMVLAMVRLWDKDSRSRAVGMQAIADDIRNLDVMAALTKERADKMGISGVEPQLRVDLDKKAAEVLILVAKYDQGGSDADVLQRLRNLRNTRLAHRQTTPGAPHSADLTDKEIEGFYQDNSKLIHILLSLVDGHAYDPGETAGVYRHYAGHFWAGVRGEQTEGHPNYRGRPSSLRAE